MKVVISSIGHLIPDTILDNNFFDSLDIGSSSEWIEQRIGIKERRSFITKEDVWDLKNGKTSFQELLANGKLPTMADISEKSFSLLKQRYNNLLGKDIDPATIGYFLCESGTFDYEAPATASTIADKLGSSAVGIDINTACSSYIALLNVARSFILSSVTDKVAAFTVDRYTARIDYNDRNNCILFGDSASATLIEKDANEGFEIIDVIMESNPASFRSVFIPYVGKMYQDGKGVQKFAITKTVEMSKFILEKNGYTTQDLSYFIGHQANYRMLTSVVNKLGLSDKQHLYNAVSCGNQAASGAAVSFSMNWDKFKSKDLVLIVVVGAGLTWGGALLRKI